MAKIRSRIEDIVFAYKSLWSAFKLAFEGYKVGNSSFEDLHALRISVQALSRYLSTKVILDREVLRLIKVNVVDMERIAVASRIASENQTEIPFNVY